MAMALFKQYLGQKGLADAWLVESAGTWAVDDRPVVQKSQLIMQERGLDLSAHRSRSVTRELLHRFDLILVMEQGHKEALLVEFPETAGRVYLLNEMIGKSRDVRDPVGGLLADFRDAVKEIETAFTQGWEKIEHLASSLAQARSGANQD
jgi:protein-tyrosine-phosphatase